MLAQLIVDSLTFILNFDGLVCKMASYYGQFRSQIEEVKQGLLLKPFRCCGLVTKIGFTDRPERSTPVYLEQIFPIFA